MTKENKRCFVIAPIGAPGSETRKRSDQVLKYIIRPAVTSCGYDAVRADEIAKPGLITSQVIQHVVNDPLVVADLTERNPNVFYELAIRHALKKPLVQISQDEVIPFDVAGTRTIFVNHKDWTASRRRRQRSASRSSTSSVTPRTLRRLFLCHLIFSTCAKAPTQRNGRERTWFPLLVIFAPV